MTDFYSNRCVELTIHDTIEYHRIRNDEDSFLRNYAGKSEREFFAVCIEHFFEAPKEFSDELPDIYIPLCNLLNQDPRNAHCDYLLEKSI